LVELQGPRTSFVRYLLLTGIPGTGKTTVGYYLADHYGFQHLEGLAEEGARYLIRPDPVSRRTACAAA
jgi:predicted kinase